MLKRAQKAFGRAGGARELLAHAQRFELSQQLQTRGRDELPVRLRDEQGLATTNKPRTQSCAAAAPHPEPLWVCPHQGERVDSLNCTYRAGTTETLKTCSPYSRVWNPTPYTLNRHRPDPVWMCLLQGMLGLLQDMVGLQKN